MTTLSLLCGMPGAGKSTLAEKLSRERSALLLSPDAWIAPLAPASDGRDDALRDRVLALQFDLAMHLLALGTSVVWDHGCWSRGERDRARLLDTPVAELKRRLALRNAALPPNSFIVTAADIDDWLPMFEAPLPDEPCLVRIAAEQSEQIE